ncbi:TetR/AcrR family transcriptional regulator [Limnoraphis robusta]|uniref:TetR/AcrR family transcriptional regulator n=1 Tax=Limnoraphis robusta TaxID=1118279 RepID=UPI002B217944|nr:TetR/AcrR family transcriptional regulator [Limnoraphis robusta]MEA5501277.1 TetR/AcrR family transcriptional regulator [Limnoraphis robusta BA-68 BA1]
MARHKEFNREEVLAKAMETFWRYGYEGTSVQDLIESMGINRGSLYDTFGDKRSLFLEAIAHYDETVVRCTIARLEAPDASKPAIIDYFQSLVDRMVADPDRRGCFVTNTAVELCPHDPDTAKRIAKNLQRIEQAFYRALSRAQEKGEIPANKNLQALARYLTCNLQGLRVITKVNPDPQILQEIIEILLCVLE